MKKTAKNKVRGYIALTIVIILIPVMMMGGVELLYNNIDFMKSAKSLSDSEKLSFSLRSCTEESIQRIKKNPLFTGQLLYTINGFACDVTITNNATNPAIKIIDSKVNSGILNKREIKNLDTSKSPYELTN